MGSENAMTTIPQHVCDLLYLCGCGLRKEAADLARVRAMDLGRVHALAASLSLSALSWYGLESVEQGLGLSGDLIDAWRTERDASIRRQALFSAERAQICAWLEDAGIWYLPLKGSVLADLYPRVGMREFCDNDILYDANRRAEVARFFKGRGYRMNVDDHGTSVDDAFTKDPVFNFEMHARLFSNDASPMLASYYEGLKDRLLACEGKHFEKRLSPEDFFLYMLAHAYKHFSGGGTGARILTDTYVFMVHEGSSLDRECLGRELEKLGLVPFEASLARLAQRVFEEDFRAEELSDEDARVLLALVCYGSYGTVEHRFENKLDQAEEQGISTGGYILGRIFPNEAWWEVNSAFAYKHKWARGPFLVFRTIRAAVDPKRRGRVRTELATILKRLRRK